MPSVLTPEAFRHQHFNLASQHVFPTMTKQFLRLRIDQDDLPFVVSHHHGVGSRFQKGTKFGLCPLPVRDVANGTRNHYAVFSLQRT